ncbi:MAG: hypothetical protein ACNA7X_01515 [Dehalococcoidia bacterium]
MTFVRAVYAVAIGGLIVMLVIFGVEAFYPAPPRPTPPAFPPVVLEPGRGGPEQSCVVLYPGLDDQASDEWKQEWDEWKQEWDRLYEEYRSLHHRSIFLVVLPLGALVAVGGTFVRRRLNIFGAGLVLGGMGTMIYAIVPSELDSLLRFVGIAVALVVLVLVGFRVFKSGDRVEGW